MQSMKKSLTRVAVTGLISAWNLKLCISYSYPEVAINRTPSEVVVSDAQPSGRPSTGVNPFDCINPACSSKMDLLKNAMKKQKNAKSVTSVAKKPIETESSDKTDARNVDSIQSDLTVLQNTEATDHTVDKLSLEILPESGCPLDKEELGRSTWDLIHTIAAYYPDSPNDTDKENARNFILSVSYLYPCEVCREDFKQSVARSPPQVESREEFCLWCCRLHNEVSAKLGYEMKFNPCSLADLDERWLVGRKACWDIDD